MNRLPLSLIAHWAGGELHGEDVVIEAITQDTRALVPGSLYVALRGERFDGHDFAVDAIARGAVALLVERLLDLPGTSQVQVVDSERALARIAAGTSLRGLSSVTITSSANSAAACPISTRLPVSRSPPAPNTITSRPSTWGRSAWQAVAMASGVWA